MGDYYMQVFERLGAKGVRVVGNGRARRAVAMETLRQLNLLTDSETARLAS